MTVYGPDYAAVEDAERAGELAPAPAPRVTVAAKPSSTFGPDVLAMVLCALVVIAVTVLAVQGVDIPGVLETIGLVAVGVGAGTAIPKSRTP